MLRHAPQRGRTRLITASVSVAALAIVVLVVVIFIANRTSNSSVNGAGSELATPPPEVSFTSSLVAVGNSTDTAGGASVSTGQPRAAAIPGNSTTHTQGAGHPASPSAIPGAKGPSSPDTAPTDTVIVCTSADFDVSANHCTMQDSVVSDGNGGLTVDGDLSFPDYMTGTIRLLTKNGTSWKRLGAFSTQTYPDVVVIDSKAYISVQLANVFAYGGHRAIPGCSSIWGIEVDDGQGLPLGDAMFTYVCK